MSHTLILLLHPPLAAALFPAILLSALVAKLALSLWLLATDESALQQRLAPPAVGPAVAG